MDRHGQQLTNFSTVFLATAALCWGLSGGIAGYLISHGWDPLTVSFYRGLIGLSMVAIWLALRQRGSGLACRQLWFWAVIAGLGVAGNFSFYFLSIERGSVAVAATLMYCAPVFVYLVSFAFKLEEPSLVKWAAITMVMFGVVLLTRINEIGADAITLFGVAAGLLSGLSYAVFIFGFKYAAPYGSPQAVLAIAFGVLVIILFWLGDIGQTFAVLSSPSRPLFILLGVLGAGVSFILYVIGVKNSTPSWAAIAAMVEPVTATLFGVLLLDESLVPSQVLGMAIILATVAVLSVGSSIHKKHKQY